MGWTLAKILLDHTHGLKPHYKVTEASSCLLSAVSVWLFFSARTFVWMCFLFSRHVIPTTALCFRTVHRVRGLFCVLGAKCFTVTTSLLPCLYVCFLASVESACLAFCWKQPSPPAAHSKVNKMVSFFPSKDFLFFILFAWWIGGNGWQLFPCPTKNFVMTKSTDYFQTSAPLSLFDRLLESSNI